MIGQTLKGRYTINARLGKGAMGTVYRATDPQTGQDVALKIISSELAIDPEMLERFKREGEALSKLKHPNIIGFQATFEHDENYIIVMEYVSGGSLYDLIKAGPLPIDRASQIALDLCDALIRAHRLNIIHRDIKPDNVLIAEDGTPRLADFGVARLTEGTRMTRTGTKVGTPYYMAPEAWMGETVDAQSDIWSLGVVMFEMLSGKVPFDGDSEFSVMTKVTTTAPPDLKELRKDVPPGLVKIVTRMLAREKEQRYQTMREVAVDLERGEPATTPLPARSSPRPEKPAPKPANPARVVTPTKRFSLSRNGILVIVGFLIIASLIVINFASPSMNESEPTERATSSTPERELTQVFATDSSIPFSPTSELGIGSTMISEKDGMTMVFVPASEFTMGSDDGESDERPVHTVYLDAFWIDQTEVTNAIYARCVAERKCNPPSSRRSFTYDEYFGNSNFDNYPVIYISWNDANAYCSWSNRRLATEAEWEKAARGTDMRSYPWGEDISCSKANFYRGCIGDTTEVGSYEGGISPYGVYDMAGNVWEWVNDWYDEKYYQNSAPSNPLGPDTGVYKVLRGGSWNYNDILSRAAGRLKDDPNNNTVDTVGFRCASSAAIETSSPESQVSLTPASLSTEITDAKGITMRLVPEGMFTMGSNNGGDDEKPIHEVYLDAFYMDIYEVTNAAYKICVEDGVCELPSNINHYNDSTYADHPVVYVNWSMAITYCEWRGAKLPSEAEWEKAARGTDTRTYPWGEDISCENANYNYLTCFGDMTKVGSYETGISPYGMYDMAGNVWEWVSSLYQLYPYDANDGRENLATSGDRIGRGGSWVDFVGYVYSTFRLKLDPSVSGNTHGFRCASSP